MGALGVERGPSRGARVAPIKGDMSNDTSLNWKWDNLKSTMSLELSLAYLYADSDLVTATAPQPTALAATYLATAVRRRLHIVPDSIQLFL